MIGYWTSFATAGDPTPRINLLACLRHRACYMLFADTPRPGTHLLPACTS
jgi:hypothetical protein